MILFNQDARVAEWMFATAGSTPMLYNMAIGIADEGGVLIGGIMFTGWNGSDVEVHFYGPGLLKRRIVRLIMQVSLLQFNVNRLTIRTRKKQMSRGVRKLGAIYEGTMKRLYGPTDRTLHSAKQYAFFRETIEKLAALKGNE
ncbi:MAG: hypothetical protein RIQ68_503 [Pseudomonadota bacterium]|jgi:hypothetical protein